MIGLRIIGDVHGRFEDYLDLVSSCPRSIQVGDFGVGFKSDIPIADMSEADLLERLGPNLLTQRFFRGNHDNPARCRAMPNFIPDGSYFPGEGIMTIGGAQSNDRHQRNMGRDDWWPDEELSEAQMDAIGERYFRVAPPIVLTHDCPTSVARAMFSPYAAQTRTGRFLDVLLSGHRPRLWVFGHWHHDQSATIDGTEFVCLDELSYLDI